MVSFNNWGVKYEAHKDDTASPFQLIIYQIMITCIGNIYNKYLMRKDKLLDLNKGQLLCF